MNRRTLFLGAIAVSVFAAVAFAMWYFAWRPTRFVDHANGFSIRFTADWDVIGKGEGAHVRALRTKGPSEGGGTGVISVLMNYIANIPDAPTYRKWFADNMTSKFPQYARIEDGLRTRGGSSVPWSQFVYRSDPGNRPAQVWQFFYVKESRGYVVTCTATPFDFERFRRDFEEIVDTFQLE